MPRQSAKITTTAAANGHPALVNLAFPGNVVAGNLIVVAIGMETPVAGGPNPSVSDNNGGGAGNTYTFELLQQASTSVVGALFWTVAGASGACTVSVSVGSTQNVGVDVVIAEYTAAGTPNIDVSHGNHAITGTTIGTGNITTLVAADVLVAYAWDGSHDAHPWSDTAGFTKEQETSNTDGASLSFWDKTVSSTGTYSDTFSGTITSGDGLAAGIAAFSGVSGASPPVPSCNTPPNGQVGISYSHTFTASSGTPPYSFSITSGALPTGLSMTSGGVVSGTPTASGTFTFTVTVTDATPLTGSVSCSITISPSPAAGGGLGVFPSANQPPQIAVDERGMVMFIHSLDAGTLDDKLSLMHSADTAQYTGFKLLPVWDWALQIKPPADLSTAFGITDAFFAFDTMSACCGRAFILVSAKPSTFIYQALFVGVVEWDAVAPV